VVVDVRIETLADGRYRASGDGFEPVVSASAEDALKFLELRIRARWPEAETRVSYVVGGLARSLNAADGIDRGARASR